jgi:hypothetical protein
MSISKAEKFGLVLSIGGAFAGLAGIGIYAYYAKKRRAGDLGQQRMPYGSSNSMRTEQLKRGDMTLTVYKDKKMPIEKRVGILQDLVWDGVRNPQMRELALAITGNGTRQVTVGKYTFTVEGANCPARDGECEAAACGRWVKNNIRYTGDIAPVKMGRNGPVEGIDLFQAAHRTVEFGGEDCDGHSALNCVLTSLNGVTCRLKVTAPTNDNDWSHIYAQVGLPKNHPEQWKTIDTTLPNYDFGVEARSAKSVTFPA